MLNKICSFLGALIGLACAAVLFHFRCLYAASILFELPVAHHEQLLGKLLSSLHSYILLRLKSNEFVMGAQVLIRGL